MHFVNGDFARGKFDMFSLTGEIVSSPSADVDSRKRRRHLFDLPAETAQGLFDEIAGDVLPWGCGDDFPLAIVRFGTFAEAQIGDVSLVTAEEKAKETGGFADGDDEEAGGIGIERTPVPDFSKAALDGKAMIEFANGTEGREAEGFVDEEESVHKVRDNTTHVETFHGTSHVKFGFGMNCGNAFCGKKPQIVAHK